jgi:hypothetical protein
MTVPYEKSFAEFLRFIYEKYPRAEFPEAFVPWIAHKATAGYVIENFFPELIPEFLKRGGNFVYAISEPGWKNSPLNIRSTLTLQENGSYELSANKAFVLDADIGVFTVRYEDQYALVIVDTDFYRSQRVPLDLPEATFRSGKDEYVRHYKAVFTANVGAVPFRTISRRDVLLLSRTIVFREQVAYAVMAAAEAGKYSDVTGINSRVALLCDRAKEIPGQDDIAVAREILSAAIVRILAQPDAHGFWKWLGRFVKPA